MENPTRVLSELDAPPESFHDCHVHGMGWDADGFSFSVGLDYILKWLEPSAPGGGYQFLVAKAKLTFQNVDALIIRAKIRDLDGGTTLVVEHWILDRVAS